MTGIINPNAEIRKLREMFPEFVVLFFHQPIVGRFDFVEVF
jgi:hypothetical protein